MLDVVYELLMQSFVIHSHSVGFPELVLPALIQVSDKYTGQVFKTNGATNCLKDTCHELMLTLGSGIYHLYLQIKAFIKANKISRNAMCNKVMSQLLLKMQENIKFITDRRRKAGLNLADAVAIVSAMQWLDVGHIWFFLLAVVVGCTVLHSIAARSRRKLGRGRIKKAVHH